MTDHVTRDDQTVHHGSARQAPDHPDGTAVTAPPGSLTYAELDARANHLAHGLRSLGVFPGLAVGVCVFLDTAPPADSSRPDPRPQCRAASPCTSWPGPGPCWCRGPFPRA
jgi:non-ribosomal peptide synthetase component F